MTERKVNIDVERVPECFRRDAPQDDPMKLIKARAILHEPFEQRAQRAREATIAIQETIILQEKIRECYLREGVNHYRNCKEVTKEYLRKIRQRKFLDGPVEMEDLK